QEGVRIPPIRLGERGRPNQAARDLIFANMRGPREREGDFRAMIGTCRKAAERVEALLGRYGHATLQACVSELLDRAEQRMRQRIRELPPGQYAYEAYLEGGHDQLEPLRVRASVTVSGDRVIVDLAGTSPQTAGPTNVGPAMAPTGAFTILKAFLDPGGEINGSAFAGDRGEGDGRSHGRRQSLLRRWAGLHLLRVPGRGYRRLGRRRRQQRRARVHRERHHDHPARGGRRAEVSVAGRALRAPA